MRIKVDKTSVFCCMIAYASLFAFSGMVKSSEGLHTISNSIISVILYFAMFYLFYYVAKLNISRRLMLISSVLGFIFSMWMVIGTNLIIYGSTNLNSVIVVLRILFGMFLFAALTVVLFLKIIPKINIITISNLFKKAEIIFSYKRSFLIIWLLILLAWIPSFIASYPGIYAYDSVFQINSYISGSIDLHHPLIHTYILGFCVVTLGRIFGSREIGLLVYSIFQMIVVSGSFSYILKFMHKRKVSFPIKFFFLLIFMFFPMNPIMAFSSTKDVIYAATFGLVLIQMFRLTRDVRLLYSRGFTISFSLLVFINIIFRTQGLYVYIFSIIIGIIRFRHYWKRFIFIAMVPLLMFAIYSGPVTKALHGVKSDSIHEMMSVPCVQLSRALYTDNGDLNSVEKQQIVNYVPNYKSYSYRSGLADDMKNTFNTKLFKSDPINFIKLWIDVGVKKPMAYVDAFTRLSIGLWYPDMNYNDPQAYHPYWSYASSAKNKFKGYILVKRQTPEFMDWLARFYYKLASQNIYQKIPIISMMFSSGFYIWMMFIYGAWCIYMKSFKSLYPLSFVFALWLTLLLGPVVLYRYVFPIAIALPIFATDAVTMPSKIEEGS